MITHLAWVLKLVWRCHWMLVATIVAATLVQSLLPAATAYASKLIIDSVVLGMGGGSGSWDLIGAAVALAFILALASAMVAGIAQLARDLLANRLFNHVNEMIMRHAISLDLTHFENPRFHDMLERAKSQALDRPARLVMDVLTMASAGVTILSFLLLLIRFNLWVVLALVITTIPSVFVQAQNARATYRLQTGRAPESRLMYYLVHVMTTEQSVKEIKLFDLATLFLSRYRFVFDRFYRQDKVLAIRRRSSAFGLSLLSLMGFYGCYVFVIGRAVRRLMTLGDLTLYGMAFQQLQSSLHNLLDSLSSVYESGLFLSTLHSFFQLPPGRPADKGLSSQKAPTAWKEGLTFRDVSFRYPDAEDYALRNINLHIRPGERIAVVGENGAGKTTLVKLLALLYEPTEGGITLDGVDLREYNTVSYQRQLSVIFQDYTRYYLSARENIGIGQVDHLEDMPRVVAAAKRSGADQIISRLPSGYETMLGRWFREGHQLSMGEWQKVALARAFMREAQLLILDEPTASLDARAEFELFQQFSQLAVGRTTVIVSHRFSTVRMVDRIVVLSDHTISEEGSHELLLRQEGLYARLFAMQAEPYVQLSTQRLT